MAKLQSSLMFAIRRVSLVLVVATSFLVLATGSAHASKDDDSGKKSGTMICPDGNPCPTIPAGAIDCTPKNGVVPKQCSWQPGQGDPADEPDTIDLDNLPDMSVVVGAARSATTFSYSALIKALGKYAALEIFYFVVFSFADVISTRVSSFSAKKCCNPFTRAGARGVACREKS